jgi:hypothetical protein
MEFPPEANTQTRLTFFYIHIFPKLFHKNVTGKNVNYVVGGGGGGLQFMCNVKYTNSQWYPYILYNQQLSQKYFATVEKPAEIQICI